MPCFATMTADAHISRRKTGFAPALRAWVACTMQAYDLRSPQAVDARPMKPKMDDTHFNPPLSLPE